LNQSFCVGWQLHPAIDHYTGLLQRCLALIGRVHPQFLEVTHGLGRHHEFGPAPDEIFDFGVITEQGAILVERDLIDCQLVA
jgi:hypothetical protein